MYKRIITACACLLFIFSLNSAAFGTDYYVSNSQGNDSNPGTIPDAPWKSLKKISSFSFKPGDRIFLKRGDEWRSEIKCPSSGTESEKIVFAAYGDGPLPRINASMPLTDWSGLSDGVYSTPYKGVCNMILEDGSPLRRASGKDLKDGQWYYDGSYIYYRPTSGSPSEHLVERTSKGAAFWIMQKSNIVIDDFDLYGATLQPSLSETRRISKRATAR